MKILMIPTNTAGVAYWRFEVPAEALQKAGHEVFCFNEASFGQAVKDEGSLYQWLQKHASEYDLIHCGYQFDLNYIKMLAVIRDQHEIPFITDIDDDINSTPTYNPGFKTYHPGSQGKKLAKMLLRISDGVTFSTNPLQESLKEDCSLSKVTGNYIIPEHWDLSINPVAEEDEAVRILLTGGSGRFGDWQILREPLEQIVRKFDEKIKLFFMGCSPDWIAKWMPSKTNPEENRAFYLQPAQEVRLFQRVVSYVNPDIVLSPVEMNTFNKSKSHLKALEAAMLNAAFLCTDWDAYDPVPNDCCIKVSNSTTQWQDSLEELITNDNLRNKLTMRSRKWCLDTQRAIDYINDRVSLYERVLEKGPVKGLDDIVRPKVGV